MSKLRDGEIGRKCLIELVSFSRSCCRAPYLGWQSESVDWPYILGGILADLLVGAGKAVVHSLVALLIR